MLKGPKVLPDIISAIMMSNVTYYLSGKKAWSLTNGKVNEWEMFVEANDESRKSAELLGFKPAQWDSTDFDRQVVSIWQAIVGGDSPVLIVLLFVNDAEQRYKILQALIKTNPICFENRLDETKAYNLAYAVLESCANNDHE